MKCTEQHTADNGIISCLPDSVLRSGIARIMAEIASASVLCSLNRGETDAIEAAQNMARAAHDITRYCVMVKAKVKAKAEANAKDYVWEQRLW